MVYTEAQKEARRKAVKKHYYKYLERSRARARAYYAKKHPSALSPKTIMTEEQRKEARRASVRKWAQNNRHKLRELARLRYAKYGPDMGREYRRRWLKAHPEKRRAYAKKWEKKNPDKVKAKARRMREKHGDKWRAKDNARYAANKELMRIKSRLYRQINPERFKKAKAKYNASGKATANSNKRRSTLLQAIPVWAAKEQAAIIALYAEAKRLKQHVDHTVPLISKMVCGLHCLANLQILPPTENLSKSNRYWPDMP